MNKQTISAQGRGSMKDFVISAVILAISLTSLTDRHVSYAVAQHVRNAVAAYLHNAELQFETPSQGAEIKKALRDMLTLTPKELQGRRYANYRLEPNVWDIITLLHKYFVPEENSRDIRAKTFYKDFAKPEARLEIQQQLEKIEKALAGMR